MISTIHRDFSISLKDLRNEGERITSSKMMKIDGGQTNVEI